MWEDLGVVDVRLEFEVALSLERLFVSLLHGNVVSSIRRGGRALSGAWLCKDTFELSFHVSSMITLERLRVCRQSDVEAMSFRRIIRVFKTTCKSEKDSCARNGQF